MASWSVLADEARDLCHFGQARFASTELCLIGTVRLDGSPRISAVEPRVVGGDLYLGMMWKSVKARDLLRDPRLTLHSTSPDGADWQGDFKIDGRVESVSDDYERDRYKVALQAAIGWAPGEERWHLFRVDLDQVSRIQVTEPHGQVVWIWRPGGPARRRTLPGEAV